MRTVLVRAKTQSCTHAASVFVLFRLILYVFTPYLAMMTINPAQHARVDHAVEARDEGYQVVLSHFACDREEILVCLHMPRPRAYSKIVL